MSGNPVFESKSQSLNQNVRVRGFRSLENQGVRQLADDCFQDKSNEEIGHYGQTLICACKETRVCTKKTSSSRPARLHQSGGLAKRQKAEFTGVNAMS